MNMNQLELDEAARVLSVLIQEYEAQGHRGSQTEQWRADEAMRGLIMALDDVSRARKGIRPIAELIKLFVKTHNVGPFRYSVVTAPHPFGFDETSEVEHFSTIELALQHFNTISNAMSVGWVALLDTKDCRVVGEIYL